jgi:hypothetical protein
MPRVAASATTVTPPSGLRYHWDNGNILLGFGGTLFAVLLADRYLQYNEGMSVEGAIGMMEEDARQKRLDILEEHRNDPTLFLCVARKVYKMGGSHSLMFVNQDDILQVLDEGIGPDNLYNLCRKMTPDGQQVVSIGWYPVQYLEKVAPPKKSWLKLAFGK